MLPPTPLWYAFFAAQGGPLLGTALSGAYLLVKLQQAVERAGLVWLAVRQVAARGHGTVPTAQEIQEAGNCPICYQARGGRARCKSSVAPLALCETAGPAAPPIACRMPCVTPSGSPVGICSVPTGE